MIKYLTSKIAKSLSAFWESRILIAVIGIISAGFYAQFGVGPALISAGAIFYFDRFMDSLGK